MRLAPSRALLALLPLAVLAWTPGVARAQISSLVSPGPLSKAHASLAGATNCEKCHTPIKGVSAEKCLSCHRPIAERIAAHVGVHRSAANDCVKCHVEHAGADADIRHFDTQHFDHARETDFPLDGQHTKVAADCVKCHKARSFLQAKPACASCHADPHNGKLGPTCTTCHSTTVLFKDAKTSFDHSKTKFPLSGAHRTVQCAKCHATKDYHVAQFSTCANCHNNVHKSAFGTACASCHNDDSWKTTKVNHAATAFPLKGRHQTVPCASCHKTAHIVGVTLKFARCADCHADPHKGEFKQECNSCHNEQGFKKAPFDHDKQTSFPLVGRHAAIACQDCHKAAAAPAGPKVVAKPGARAAVKPPAMKPPGDVVFKGLSTACTSCHKDPHAGELGAKCDSCHSISTFRIPSYVHQHPSDFFAGQHATVACAECHAGKKAAEAKAARVTDGGWQFASKNRKCADCHNDVHLGQLGNQCETCHTVAAAKFEAVAFSHDRSAFKLTGRHKDVPCAQCHHQETGPFPGGTGTAIRLKGLGTSCLSCHKDIHLGQLGNLCEHCHTTSAFKMEAYKHEGSQDFFGGKHATLKCLNCHKTEEGLFPAGKGAAVRYKGGSFGRNCTACHTDHHNGALGHACESCHSPETWTVVSRAFHKDTVFPLDGKHVGVPCGSCHLNGVTKSTPTGCYDCHWIRRQDDRYQTRLGTQCENCHSTTSWAAVRWNHGSATGVPLNAQHSSLPCEACHKNQVFTTADVQCSSCHMADYQRTTSPNHAAAGFPTTCNTCHQASDPSFTTATFNHAMFFQLVGVHATQQCAACHKNNTYTGTPSTCYGCHQADYQRTTNPNHVAAGFPTTCDSCHHATDPTFTSIGGFNHAMVFPLVGVHASQQCAACHKNNVYTGTPTTCYGCHQAQYQSTTNPNHVAAGFPTTCDTCHHATDPSFTAIGSFNHAMVFPLVGVHATLQCASCHVNNVFGGTPTTCYGCHQAQYQSTTNPNHASAGFPTTCDACHKATDPNWTVAVFNHSTFFPLVGVHATQPCAACHKNNVFAGTPTSCYGCHQANYQATTNPNHIAAGFPTTCETCHRATDTSWNQGTFNHTAFPITSGPHAGHPCSVCHNDPTNFAVFTCLTCHLQAPTAANHTGVSGYRYDSNACYACHPRGSGG